MHYRLLMFVSLAACSPVVLMGCAAKGPIQPLYVAEMAKGEALLSDGCYTCLQQSLALFEKALTMKSPPPGGGREGLRRGAFDLAAREGAGHPE